MKNNDQKVFFVQDIGEGKYITESLWCDKVGDYFVIDNIPFIAKNISLGDTIKAEYDNEDKVFYFDDFVAESGNTTLRLYFNDISLIEIVRKQLNDYHCESEVLLQRKIVAVNVPKEIEYKPIKEFLDKGEDESKWTYEESCLAHKY
jgi:hypothetical protein